MEKLLFVFLGSAVVLLQTALLNRSDFYHAFALTISVSSTVITVTLLLLLRLDRGKAQDCMKFVVLLLVVMWIGGTSVMTLKAPFPITGNGYFGAWVALAFSWTLAIHYFPAMKGPMDSLVREGGVVVAALTLASLTVFAQTVWNCLDNSSFCRGEALWILICSGVSLFITALLHVPSVSQNVHANFKFVALFLLIWWIAGFFVATFDSPFVLTGNGFFGCWVAVVTSAMLVDSSWELHTSEKVGDTTRGVIRELLGVAIGSVVTLIASTYKANYNDFWGTWAVVCSAVSTGVCVFLIIVMKAGYADKVSSYMHQVSWFLLVWWVIGTGFMTFKGPFIATSNGYFGAWLALVAAFMLCQSHSDMLKRWMGEVGGHGNLFAILCTASVVLFIQALNDLIDDRRGRENIVFAIICSFVSSLACVLIASRRLSDDVLKWVILALFVLWAIAVGLLTFDAPYVFTGNGYFACWAALIVSKLYVWRLFPEVARSIPEAGEAEVATPKPSEVTAPAATVVGAAPSEV